MGFEDDREYRNLSELQHFSVCRRQWALIHVEHQWQENQLTAEGAIMHDKVHDGSLRETKNDIVLARGIPVRSEHLKAKGVCDMVEFHPSEDGVALYGLTGLWKPVPIEYKHGSPEYHHADVLQLCGQAMCLEEMLCCRIPNGFLYYGQTRHRFPVIFSDLIRLEVTELLQEMNRLFEQKYTPKARKKPICKSCSLKDICLPSMFSKKTVNEYVIAHVEEEE